MNRPPYIAARRKLFENVRDRLDCIEPRIRPLVAAMSRRPDLIQTIASCEGHFRAGCRPYVLFRCSPAFAASLRKQIYRWNAEGKLSLYWFLYGTFTPFDKEHPEEEWELCFCLELRGIEAKPSLNRFHHYVIRRDRIDRDLRNLAQGIQDYLDDVGAFGESIIDEHRNGGRDG